MIPFKLLQRYIKKLLFILPVIWFVAFILSFYVEDINTYTNSMKYPDQRAKVQSEASIEGMLVKRDKPINYRINEAFEHAIKPVVDMVINHNKEDRLGDNHNYNLNEELRVELDDKPMVNMERNHDNEDSLGEKNNNYIVNEGFEHDDNQVVNIERNVDNEDKSAEDEDAYEYDIDADDEQPEEGEKDVLEDQHQPKNESKEPDAYEYDIDADDEQPEERENDVLEEHHQAKNKSKEPDAYEYDIYADDDQPEEEEKAVLEDQHEPKNETKEPNAPGMKCHYFNPFTSEFLK